MKSKKYLVLLALLNALGLFVSDMSAQAGQHKEKSNRRGGKATTHMSTQGSGNTNAQWSADPERGWVRANERHELKEQQLNTSKSEHGRGKKKGHSKKSK